MASNAIHLAARPLPSEEGPMTDVWERLRGLGLTWSGLAATLIALVAALFLRRLLPRDRAQRGKATVALLAVAPALHFLATGVGLLGFRAPSAILELVNLLFLAFGITGAVGLLVFDVTLGRTRVPTIARDVVQALAFMVVFFGVLHASGFEPLSLLTTSAILTAVIGLALQNIMANLLAGLALQIDRTFVLGDWIQVGNRVGRIDQIRWRSTAIRTREGDTALIPNASLLSNEVLNFSRPTGAHQCGFAVPFGHRHAPEEVKAVVLRAVSSVPTVLAEPAPTCSPDEFGAGVVSYRVRYWVDDFAMEGNASAEVKTRVWYAARRAGLDGPCPPGAGRLPPADGVAASRRAERDHEIEARVSALAKVAVLAPLDAGERAGIARGLREVLFAADERIIAEGDPGDSLYVLERGEVEVEVGSGSARRQVARLGPGDVFGEMSLFTGEPRQASCTAINAVRCYLIDYPLARQVLAARPAMVGEISAELARRQGALEGERARLAAEREGPGAQAPARLLARMKAYFLLD
jgi:small-conductance mechanosensitive channel/CRP-like cAMP-binding protein